MTTASLRGRPEGFHSGSSRQNVLQRTRRVWQYRRILELLVRRDLKVRYAGSALGYLWTVLDPLLMSLVYWFVFTHIFHRNAGPQNEPFMLYLVSGQLIWAWFSGGITSAARAIRSEAQMVRSSNVPRELWVVRVAVSKGIEYLFGLPVVALYALAYWKAPTLGVLLLPLACLMCFLLVLGVGLILAPLTVLVRDVDRIIPIVMRVLFYASPVLYNVAQVPASIREAYNFNPAVGVLSMVRATFFPADFDWTYVWHSMIGTAVILALGIFVFTRLERPVLKEI
jgi:ABC-type polysaccharide/polyol phosphate export permease